MSTNRAAPAQPPRPIFRGPMGAGFGPPQKAKSFKASGKRLLARLAPERALVVLVLLCALASVALTVSGPRLLGDATNIIFGAIIAHQSIDLDGLARALEIVLAVYTFASIFAWLQSHILNHVVQRSVKRLRTEVEDKLMRVPLSYFDGQPHGEILSRVTNDIDNISMGLQQSLTQILNSLLIVVGILVMLFWISPLLAAISIVSVVASVFVTMFVLGRRAITDWSTLALFVVALLVVLRVRSVPEPVLLLAAAVIGVAIHGAPL